MTIRKATVLGAGVMGSQIAALLVNAGLRVKILDIAGDRDEPNEISKKAYDTITDKKRPQLFDLSFASNLTYGNFEEDLTGDDGTDIYIEAVKEDLGIKHEVWDKVRRTAGDRTLFATNTSGIPIASISKVFDDSEKKRFFGMHFFNPPRIMKLVEVIPYANTSSDALEEVQLFLEDVLGKGVVIANDVPAFVANRIGTQTMNDIMFRAEQQGFSIAETDALTGRNIGRPGTGTYGLVDLVGLDIAVTVIRGLQQIPEEKQFFHDTKIAGTLMEKGAFGKKKKQGFYKKGKEDYLVFDPESNDYITPDQPEFHILGKFGRDLGANLDAVFNAEDEAGRFLWETLRNNFYYSALNVPKAASDYADIDRAMVWGFNWKKGPFQLWDMMGFERVKERMENELGELPGWIKKRDTPFYSESDSIERVTPVSEFTDSEIWNREDSLLSVAHSDQLLLKLQSRNNIISDDFAGDLIESIDLLENEDYSSMVIYAEGRHFSVGADLYLMKKMHEDNRVEEIVGPAIDKLHESFNRLKYALKPVVTAVYGKSLGGGCELVLHSPIVVAASETYMGLVEAGVGLVPSGGGLAEMADRILSTGHMQNDKQKTMTEVMTNIAFAKVSTNAHEALKYKYLRNTDTIILNAEKRVEIALERARYESETNYIPKPKVNYTALGRDYKALAKGQLDAQRTGNFISDYDYEVTLDVAHVLSGGELPRNTIINQGYIQKLEKERFLTLLQNDKTYNRIKHMLETGKPLRN
ncbi:3-hydroxyacyl-CoA dehydrogenase NAD-binding domain-containing protein [Salinicoccus carnicancri]|uniref:3-hydroxyacyl-CoA dehydrogenase/crotonase FadB n=1 Tax=Salinicoccus carnicancri TaxID=558170 RepID=UPI0003066D56|nr:3-hydroxyacyl-CoA dehydrogenase NAD-binding domain-containing protein [Salinicoccus carnicancri]